MCNTEHEVSAVCAAAKWLVPPRSRSRQQQQQAAATMDAVAAAALVCFRQFPLFAFVMGDRGSCRRERERAALNIINLN